MANIPTFTKGNKDDLLYDDELNQTLRNNISDNGFVTPSQSMDNIESLLTSMPDGTNWYDSDNNRIVYKINGALYAVNVTAI